MAQNCKEYYPDIFEREPDEISAGDSIGGSYLAELSTRNAERKRLYVGVRFLLRQNFGFDRDDSTTPDPASFPGGFGKKSAATGAKSYDDLLSEEKAVFLSVYGLLLANNYVDPSFGRQSRGIAGPLDIWVPKDERPAPVKPKKGEIAPDANVLLVERFIEATTEAMKTYSANKTLFKEVYKVLFEEGKKYDETGKPTESTVFSRQLAEVTRRLIDERVDADDPQIRRYVLNALDSSIGGKVDGRSGYVDIDLPDLDTGTAVDIIPDNVRAVAAIYFSAMLEEMKLYSVTDKVAEHFVTGMLPVSRGAAGERIYEWIRGAPLRFNEMERRGVYGRVLGLAQGGATEVAANREFSDLWIRFLSTVSLLSRDAVTNETRKIVAEQVHKTARDLAVNVSLHGFGVAHFAAVEMQKLIRQMKEMLSRPELLTAYGVNDVWQLNDRVAALYLNGATNGVRYRTMARAGGSILQWLARNAPQLASASKPDSLDFSDRDLVFQCESWLAVTGTPDASVEKYTDPIDLQQQPTVPMMPFGGASTSAGGNLVKGALDRLGLGAMPTPGPVQ